MGFFGFDLGFGRAIEAGELRVWGLKCGDSLNMEKQL